MLFFKKQEKKQNGKERRSSPRVIPEHEFAVDFESDGFSRMSGIGGGKDLSTSGVRFATFAPLKKGQRLEMTLTFSARFPRVSRLVIVARVVRIYRPKGAKRFRIGCQFIELETHASELETIRQFMEWVKLSKHSGPGLKAA